MCLHGVIKLHFVMALYSVSFYYHILYSTIEDSHQMLEYPIHVKNKSSTVTTVKLNIIDHIVDYISHAVKFEDWFNCV